MAMDGIAIIFCMSIKQVLIIIAAERYLAQ